VRSVLARGLAAGACLIGALGVATAHATTAVHPRVAIILVDTNNSPTSARLPLEIQQALAYAGALPADVEVGLIVFGDTWRMTLAPTANRTALATKVAAVKTAGATSNGLRSALAGALAELHRLGAAQSRLLVLSNGEFLKQAVHRVAVPVDAVPSDYDPDDFPSTIRALAAATGGRLGVSTDVADLAAAFRPLASSPPPRSPSPSRSAGTGPQAVSPASPGGHMKTSLGIALGLVFVALLVISALALRALRPGDRRPRLTTQIGQYGPMGSYAGPRVQKPLAPGRAAGAALVLMKRLLSARSAEPKLARRLDDAGINRQPAEWALLGVCGSIGLAAAFSLLFGNVFLGVLFGIAAGWATMRLVLDFKIRRRRAAFDEQLPNVLNLIAGSLQSGFSLAQAMDAVVRENAQPASGEFGRAIAENRLGVDLTDALDAVALRMESADLRWVVMTIRIQRETGGNLAEVLRNTVGTMRERGFLRRQVRTLSAEGRLSAYVLITLPVLIGAWMFYANPTYMSLLYTTVYGLVMLVGSVLLVIVGAFWMRNLIRLEV
jgi:Flp pilus assembly protein TadB